MEMKVPSSYDRKHFRFHLWKLALITIIVLTSFSSGQTLSGPNSCKEVAVIVGKSWLAQKEWTSLTVKIDYKLVKKVMECVKYIQQLYKQTSWQEVQKVITPEVRNAISSIPKLSSKSLSMAGNAGASLMSAYFLYKTIELYDRAVTLRVSHELYRKEFETLLSKRIRPLLYSIDLEVPHLHELDRATLRKVTQRRIEQLHDVNEQLESLMGEVLGKLEESSNDEKLSLAYAIGTSVFSAGSFMLGFPVAVWTGLASTAVSIVSHISFIDTTHQLKTLRRDLNKVSNEINQYLILLEHKSNFMVESNFIDDVMCFLFGFLIVTKSLQLVCDLINRLRRPFTRVILPAIFIVSVLAIK